MEGDTTTFQIIQELARMNRANAILSGIFCTARPAIFLVAQKPAQEE